MTKSRSLLQIFDFDLSSKYCNTVIGIDEVGRGCIAGPVVCCACVFDLSYSIDVDVADSKTITAKKREFIFENLSSKISFSFGFASCEEVDDLNILRASLLGMTRALNGLGNLSAVLIVDGKFIPDIPDNIEPIKIFPVVSGDSKSRSVATASIFAKVKRDKMMLELDKQFPEYGFKNHKGYPTKQHIDAIAEHGITNQHRKTFAPVRRVLNP